MTHYYIYSFSPNDSNCGLSPPCLSAPPARREERLLPAQPGVAAALCPVITLPAPRQAAAPSVLRGLCSSLLWGDRTRQELGLEAAPVGSACVWGGVGRGWAAEGEACAGEAETEGAFVSAQAGEERGGREGPGG